MAANKSINARTDLNEALRHASRVNDFEKVKELLQRNADPNTFYVRAASRKQTRVSFIVLSALVRARALADRLYATPLGQHVWPQGGGRGVWGRL